MKKLVNGKVVDIKNIELFEMAAEGEALQNTAISSTSDGIDTGTNTELITRYIKQYDIFFKAMPYPLYAIESDIKYATLANFIKHLNKKNNNMWINNGLYIQIDMESLMTLHIVNNTWSIEYVEHCIDNTAMEGFKDAVGYEEYIWLLNKVINRESTSNYYDRFMPEFISACKNNEMVIKWELENILNFASVPKKLDLIDNKILDLTNNCEYSIDTYVTKVIETEDKSSSWNLTYTNKIGSHTNTKQMKIYGFDVYSKNLSSDAFKNGNNSDKITKTQVPGMQSLFVVLTGIKNAQEKKNFPIYKGFIIDGHLVYTVDKSLFITKSNRIAESKEVARNIEIYGIDRNNVFFSKNKKITDSITREAIYSYNLADGSIKLCNIRFKY